MSPESSRLRARTTVRSGVAGAILAVLTWSALTVAGVVTPPSEARAADGSAVTVTAQQQDPDYLEAPFPNLSVTVSQTQDLVQQGIEVSWSGASASVPPTSSSGGRNFLQIFQCWGDDPTNAQRPDRTTCQYGGVASYGATRDATRVYEYEEIPEQDQPYSAPRASDFEGAYTSIPFRGRDGGVVSSLTTGAGGVRTRDTTVDVNNNKYFNLNSTNEVSWAGSGVDGKGSISFEIQTTMQSPGLGCGDAVELGGVIQGASCWLVILPRGRADNGSAAINQSGLFWESWKHALAVRIGFAPVGARCPVGAAERQLAGSEVASLAVQSWQPVVCKESGGAVFSHLTSAESDALLSAATTRNAALALTSYPSVDSDDLVYAPVALSGIAISFAVDRNPSPFLELPDGYGAAARQPFEELKLTPRLLAKLLTNSYWGSLPPELDRSYLDPDNPENITKDKEFLALNSAEWAYQVLVAPSVADVLMPQGRSDAARAVWTYIMSDPEAAAFMAGQPDPNGMVVNPWYATDAAKNPTGTAFSAPRDNFPKADPAEVVPPQRDPVNVVTWRPYVNDLDSSAYFTLRGDGQTLGEWDPNSSPAKYNKGGRSLPGFQRVLGITDAAAAQRYEVHVAALRNPAGQFVQPTEAAMLAAAAVMQPATAGGAVREFSATSPAAVGAGSAYPLTVPVYAAADPALLDSDVRADYAEFIRFAATDGQTAGVALGELPAGYAPLPAGWVDQARAAADQLETGVSPSPSPSPSSGDVPFPSGSGSGGSSTPVDTEQPDAEGDPAPALSSVTTPVDPEAAVGGALPVSLLAGLGAALVSGILSRRKAIRPWVAR
ncbi:hypothetical protein [Protaetiibacter larvae]|uniref:PBP domain-containing protein n=1 Tax=Protaetiibacter larvae TaxID=2592654 RepID=A0A5C1Y6F6_9MICO|nr:hypothetical protein [Protaetiibacter larvae]QEO09484.1 hypothetical protein FLP23_05335 [Protaetiibacter larvae]